MSSDQVHDNGALRVEELRTRVRASVQKAARTAAFRDRLAQDLAQQEQEILDLGARVEKLSKVAELFKYLMDLIVDKQVRSVESIVTQGFKTIFHDLNLSFESEIAQRNNKIAVDFYIRQGSKEDGLSHRGRPLEAFGGGPCTIASLLLRVLAIRRLNLYPLLAMDEALAASDEYIESSSRFIAGLGTQMKMDILLVTHKQGYLEHAIKAYRCTEDEHQDGTKSVSLRALSLSTKAE